MGMVEKRAASAVEKRHQAGMDLLRVLVDPSSPPAERQRAKASLSRIGTEALIPELDKALKASSDDEVREDLVEVLAALPPCQQLQKRLLTYLHQVPSVRRRAIVALGEIGDEKALFYLGEVAREGDQPGKLVTREDSRLALEAINKIKARIAE
jgi:HEAT repeat protein